MLYTNLKHLETADALQQVITEHENVMVVCGRMGPMCIPVYRIAEDLEKEYDRVRFFDMEFDNPESAFILNLPDVKGFMSIPFTVYFRKGQVVKATAGIQTRTQMVDILDSVFAEVLSA